MTTPATTELVITRTFAHAPETVFAAWTTPESLSAWWGTADHTGSDASIEARAGGTWRACMTSPDGTAHWSGGDILAIDPPRHLKLTFAWESVPDNSFELDLTFTPVPGGTEMTFRQRLSASAAAIEGFRTGWEETFTNLETWLSTSTHG